MARMITIVGCGPGGEGYLSQAAREAVARCQVIAGASRLCELFPEFEGEVIHYSGTEKFLHDIEAKDEAVAVLVSGDPAIFSLAEKVINHFGKDKCEVIPAVGSVQVAFERINESSVNAEIISAHAMIPTEDFATFIKKDKFAVLGGNNKSAQWLLKLCRQLEPTHQITLCSDLTLPDEKILVFSDKLDENDFSHNRLVVVFIKK